MLKPTATIALFLVSAACLAGPAEMCEIVRGAKIIADNADVTYIGSITNPSDEYSIFNESGPFGDKASPLSVWNAMGEFGNPYSQYSVANTWTKTPPVLYNHGKKIGYLTANEEMGPWVKLLDIKDLCRDKL